MKILIINAHLNYPGWSEGKLNLTFMEAAKAFFTRRGQPKLGVPTVAETFVERGYKPEEEVEKHAAAGLVILQTPVNWFGAPWIYKKYVDEVFNAALASKVMLEGDGRTRQDPSKQYGTGGKMQGRKFMISATWNAPRDTFDNPDSFLYGGKGTADLFLPITSNYKFCGYDILPAFGVFDIYKNPDIPRALEDYQRHLEKYCL
ncbi:MAG TPA: NAD(P)H-dependent oxidoreductase [Verrucomicrobiae bacterium]|nr:NAD(P)H-dependent oxidoreductase [Verrucomicrobiae bacterium]